MKKLLMIKYAPEIFLKGLNRGSFERRLRGNIKRVLEGESYEFINDMGRWFISAGDIESMAKKVARVFGVNEVCIVSQIEPDMDEIYKEALSQMQNSNAKTFKVNSRRADKSFSKHTMDINKDTGAFILDNDKDVKVDVIHPELVINIEVREKAYVYSGGIKGVCGLPYGINGSTLLMLSGGIDSPVAGYMMARRGVNVSCIYYHSHPYTSERAKDKVKDLARILKGYTGSIDLYIAPFTDIQMQIIEKCPEDELTIIMRRFMMRIACRVAEMKKIDSITTGESVGQVASQTMQGLVVSTEPSDRPTFRPLIAMDKEEIMDYARKIGTYDTSILPYEDCCTIFVPKHPKTRPSLQEIIESEKALNIDELVENSIKNMEMVRL